MNEIETFSVNNLKESKKFSDMVPEMNDIEYKDFIKSIKENGVRQPIHILKDKTILDGRHRVKACKELDIKEIQAVVHDFNEDEAIEFVRDTAIERRNITKAQKIDIILRSEELISELTERVRMNQGRRSDLTSDPTGPEVKKTKNTNEAIADMAGAGKTTVTRMKKIRKEDPESYKQVLDGERGAWGAYQELPSVKKNKDSKGEPKPKKDKRKEPEVTEDPYKNIPKEKTEFTMTHSNLIFNLDNITQFLKENKKKLPEAIQKVSKDNPKMLEESTKEIEHLIKLIKQNEEN